MTREKKHILKLLKQDLDKYQKATAFFGDETIKEYPNRTLEWCAKQRKEVADMIELNEQSTILVKREMR